MISAEVIVLRDDVLFAFNQSSLTPSAQSKLDSLMSKLQNADVVSIKVILTGEGRGELEPVADNAQMQGARKTVAWSCTSTAEARNRAVG